jgi:RNA polymerase sigma-70 factor, ECF subfamily
MRPSNQGRGMGPDREQFERLFRDHYGQLLAFAYRRTHDMELARDITASAFLVAWRRREDMPDDKLPWLYGVARNEIGTHLRSRGRAAALLARLRRTADAAPQIDADPSLGRGLGEAFNGLSQRDRETLSLHAWEGLDRERAASALECSVNAYTIRLHRARRRLAERLDDTESSGGVSERAITPSPSRQGSAGTCESKVSGT